MTILAETQPSRQGYVSAVSMLPPGIFPTTAGDVQPGWLSFVSLDASQPVWSGAAWAGTWLNCSFRYLRPGSRIPAYKISAAVFVSSAGGATGKKRVQRVYLRSCSCPDGLARVGQRGAAGHCKHLIALQVRCSEPVALGASLLALAWALDQAQYAPDSIQGDIDIRH